MSRSVVLCAVVLGLPRGDGSGLGGEGGVSGFAGDGGEERGWAVMACVRFCRVLGGFGADFLQKPGIS